MSERPSHLHACPGIGKASVIAAVMAAAAAGGSLLWPPRPLLLWNASASMVPGLYSVSSGWPRTGETVVAWPPSPARRLAAARGYLPSRVPLVKHVAGVAGDRLCARGRRILVNGRLAAVRRPRDPRGRIMPSWSGCRVLRSGELFLLSPGVADAFDGRYFGVTRKAELIGKARLLWAKPGGEALG